MNISLMGRRRAAPTLPTLLSGLLVAVLSMAGCASLPQDLQQRDLQQQEQGLGHAVVAEAIRERYEQALPDLPPSKQRHYAQRLYRVTGDARYLPLNHEYGRRLVDRVRDEIEALATPGHAERRAREKVAAYPVNSEKQRRRKQMLAEWGEIAYANGLAFDLTQAKYHGLLNETDLPGHDRVLEYLASVDFRTFLLDPEVMAIYAAQVANLVYYLEDLGVTDLREEVITAFREQYPPQRDPRLSTAEYRNKIYGMTHFVIAASDYYQQPVAAEEFRWVLDEFTASLDRILADTKEDIYTEVGISFLLAGEEDHPAVMRLRDALVAAYDPEARMVPSERGRIDLASGEHRNVLAIMLLDWPDRLHPGPKLYSLQE
ncbi:DUF3541 domain-containing protein [Halomonas daqiaonensis]|uniref:DUF3541 domain-containing protein n=1 Tax=Halomonas daqiaonensis TaxID=650850 RepID=A0A1H7QUR0_9GAMM|nr:DUF3541 domain-containing protein [Halomonas daqiaonensis]SEL51047.1 protein of unknown function [Halomonas daqiaonensis]